MLQFESNSVKGYKDMDIPYTILSKTDEPKGLAIIFPGAGYTVQAPLLHYSTDIFLEKSFDVLHVDFPYADPFYDDFTAEEFNAAILFDSKVVVDHVLAENFYENFYLIGKSIGTIALSSELERSIFQSAKVVWLTPLLQKDEVFNDMVTGKNKGLCLIGDKDPWYVVERYNQILQNPHMTSKLIPNVNHILEYDDDVFGSIDILKDIITEIEQFS